MEDNYKKEIDFDMLAELSKLEFEESEKESLKKELADFLGLINQIKNVYYSENENKDKCRIYNVFRDDIVCNECCSPEEMLSNAKTCSDGYIPVPRVVEESDND